MSRVPFIDLSAQYHRAKPPIDAAIQRVLDHGRYIMGPEVEELETALCDFSGCAHAIGVASGTDALLMAQLAEGVGPGQAVFLPSFTFTASAEVVLLAGAVPVFVDVNQRTFNLDVDHLKTQIASVKSAGTLEPKAIIAVDLFGLPADYSEIARVADDEALVLIADAAQSFGATIDDTRVGNFARVTTTSFYPAKPLGCYGDGGALFTNDSDLAERLRSIRQHGEGRNRYDNVRLDAEKIATAIYYPIPMHLQPAYAACGEGVGSLPVSEDLCRRILSLPMHPYMDEATAERICVALTEAIQ